MTPIDETHQLAQRMLRTMQSADKLIEVSVDESIEQLNLNQLRTLLQIRNHPSISQKEIAEKLSITPASVSVAIRRMEELELIERRVDESDARIMRLHLGQRGQRIVKAVEAQKVATLAEMLSVLDLHERRVLVELLERALSSVRHSPPPEDEI